MSAALIILRPSRAEAACRDASLRERAMDAVGALVCNAGDSIARLAMARRIVRYAVTIVAHLTNRQQAAAYLQSLAGQILADEFEPETIREHHDERTRQGVRSGRGGR